LTGLEIAANIVIGSTTQLVEFHFEEGRRNGDVHPGRFVFAFVFVFGNAIPARPCRLGFIMIAQIGASVHIDAHAFQG
jgi:hypothetical protein